MVAASEDAFLSAHRKRLGCYWDSIRSRLPDWRARYEWPRGVTVETALYRRAGLEKMIQRDMATLGFLSKATFDAVMLWGFGTVSGCSDAEIQRATEPAFERLRTNRIAEAASKLLELPKIGISRASKILALSDQNEFGIYDSRSAHGLSDLLDSSARRLISIPPGRVIAGDSGTASQFCIAFQNYTWVLREFRRLARADSELRTTFATVADLEIAFFARSRRGSIEGHGSAMKPPKHLAEAAALDEESLFWTLGRGAKAKSFRVIFDGSSVTVLTGTKKTQMTLQTNQVAACLRHFGTRWFPLSNTKTTKDRHPLGLGEYFARRFGSSVFASHFAALWVHQGRLEARFKGGLCLRVLEIQPQAQIHRPTLP